MMDSASPFAAWDDAELRDTSSGLTKNDLVGKPHFYLKKTLAAFLAHVTNRKIKVHLLNVNANTLSRYVEHGTFARIEVSSC